MKETLNGQQIEKRIRVYVKKKVFHWRKMKRLEQEVVEQAVLNVQNDTSYVNLISLLKLTHGYDSFRVG